MKKFELDSRLTNDCIVLGELSFSLVLLMNNSLLPWFVLVPRTSETEIIDLSQIEQLKLQEEINLIASFVKNYFLIKKLNIAAIGNIVSQLHIHIVGRDPSDYCWPNVVWGTSEREPYSELRIAEIVKALKSKIGTNFK